MALLPTAAPQPITFLALGFLLINLALRIQVGAAVKHLNFYQRYFIEDVCSSNQSIIYILDSNGLYSAAEIRASRFQWVRNNLNCSITIRPPYFHGIILTVDSMTFGYSSTLRECTDYIQVFSEKEMSSKVCGHSISGSFVSRGEMTLVYHTSDSKGYLRQAGFTLIATTYSRGLMNCGEDKFKCKSDHCIWENFACDGIRNCEDDSDEDFGGLSKCRNGEIEEFTARPINSWNLIHPTVSVMTDQSRMTTLTTSAFCLLFVLMTALLRVYCYRWNQRNDRVIESQLAQMRGSLSPHRSSNSNERPPPYSTIEMVQTTAPQDTPSDCPPPYSVLMPEEESKSSLLSETEVVSSSNRPQSKEQSTAVPPAAPPPPPYSLSTNT